jgi:hypothetical protein
MMSQSNVKKDAMLAAWAKIVKYYYYEHYDMSFDKDEVFITGSFLSKKYKISIDILPTLSETLAYCDVNFDLHPLLVSRVETGSAPNFSHTSFCNFENP